MEFVPAEVPVKDHLTAKRESKGLPPVTVSHTRPWAYEVSLYAATGAPGINHEEYTVSIQLLPDSIRGRLCAALLHRDPSGDLRGILNFFPDGDPGKQAPGSFIVVVDPGYRGQGIGKGLLAEADRRWSLNFDEQNYTIEGRALAAAFLRGRD